MTRDCAVCGGRLTATHKIRELMFGLREVFEYGECGSCGSLELLDVPSDLGRYYPPEYYSFAMPGRAGPTLRLARRLRAEAVGRGYFLIARMISRGTPFPAWQWWLREAGANRKSAICDIGCGNGQNLVGLREHGFTNLTGADAFINESTTVNGIPVYKATPNELTGVYDFVMLNHSFEHMPDPRGTLQSLRGLIRNDGCLMIRMPVAGCWAWRQYGTSWAALDAPRHLHIISAIGLAKLASECGLRIRSTVYDSTGIQIWRSEQYQRDIALLEPGSYEKDPEASMFTRDQIEAWESQAENLNACEDGDAAAFFLVRSGEAP